MMITALGTSGGGASRGDNSALDEPTACRRRQRRSHGTRARRIDARTDDDSDASIGGFSLVGEATCDDAVDAVGAGAVVVVGAADGTRARHNSAAGQQTHGTHSSTRSRDALCRCRPLCEEKTNETRAQRERQTTQDTRHNTPLVVALTIAI